MIFSGIQRLLSKRKNSIPQISRYFDEITENGKVIAGPFTGIKMRKESFYSSIYGKLLGSYESELHEFINMILKIQPSLIIDIGAAEGFYACGFATKCPNAKIIAYEADSRFRYFLKRNCIENKVEKNVEILGECLPNNLNQALDKKNEKVFILCDAEGSEHEILDLERCPGLANAIILVETHEFAVPGVTKFLKNKFQNTHKINEIYSCERNIKDIKVIRQNIPKKKFDYFFKERPFQMQWLWMMPWNGTS